jgi:hypothetical protein
VEKYATHTGRHNKSINFAPIAATPEYREFVSVCAELQLADLTGIKDDELKSFWINVYNTLAFHANTVTSLGLQGIPPPDKETGIVDYLIWGKLGYVINGQKFCLHDILNGMLRGNQKAPKRKLKSAISTHDPRAQFVTKFDPRIHFALFSSAKASAAVGAFGRNLEFELQTATEGFLAEEVIADAARKELLLPKVFYYYGRDFGKNEAAVLKWIAEFLPIPRREELEAMTKQKISLRYNRHDWDLNNLVSGESIGPSEDSEEEYISSLSEADNSPSTVHPVTGLPGTSPVTKRRSGYAVKKP